jgi:hypothetical protein
MFLRGCSRRATNLLLLGNGGSGVSIEQEYGAADACTVEYATSNDNGQPDQFGACAGGSRPNRDRGRPHDLSPPTPPDIRVTYPAVRWRPSAMGAPLEAWQPPAVDVAARQGDGQGRATA